MHHQGHPPDSPTSPVSREGGGREGVGRDTMHHQGHPPDSPTSPVSRILCGSGISGVLKFYGIHGKVMQFYKQTPHFKFSTPKRRAYR